MFTGEFMSNKFLNLLFFTEDKNLNTSNSVVKIKSLTAQNEKEFLNYVSHINFQGIIIESNLISQKIKVKFKEVSDKGIVIICLINDEQTSHLKNYNYGIGFDFILPKNLLAVTGMSFISTFIQDCFKKKNARNKAISDVRFCKHSLANHLTTIMGKSLKIKKTYENIESDSNFKTINNEIEKIKSILNILNEVPANFTKETQ